MKAIRLLVSSMLFVSTAHAASPTGGPPNGERIAQSVCVECHAVGGDETKPSTNPKAPRFIDVAAMPSTTELSLKVFLRSSHKDMPNLMLDEQEADAVSKYILALRKK